MPWRTPSTKTSRGGSERHRVDDRQLHQRPQDDRGAGAAGTSRPSPDGPRPFDSEVICREHVREQGVDILMTNYVMLELILTRHQDREIFPFDKLGGLQFSGPRRGAHLHGPPGRRCRMPDPPPQGAHRHDRQPSMRRHLSHRRLHSRRRRWPGGHRRLRAGTLRGALRR